MGLRFLVSLFALAIPGGGIASPLCVYLAVRAGDPLVFGLVQQTPVGRYLVQRAEGG